MSNSAQNKIPFVPQDTLDPAAGLNDAIRVVDALLNTRVENMTQNSPTSADAVDGLCFVVGAAPVGPWAGHAHAIAVYVATGAFWQFYEAGQEAWLVLNKADGNLYKWNPTTPAWEIAAGIGEAPLDGNYYGRKDGTWAAMPDVTRMVTSVNGVGPDSSGNVAIDAGAVNTVNGVGPDSNKDILLDAAHVPFKPTTASGLTAMDVEAAIDELAARGGTNGTPLDICLAYASANFSTPGGSTNFTIPLNAASYDNNALFDATNHRIVIKRAGIYLLHYQRVAASPPVFAEPSIWVNGTQVSLPSVAGSQYYAFTSALVYLQIGDVITASVYQMTAVTLSNPVNRGLSVVGPLDIASGGAAASSGGRVLLGAASLSAAGTALTVSGLAINAGDIIEFEAEILNAVASSVNINLYYNGDTTAANYAASQFNVVTSITGSRLSSNAEIAGMDASQALNLNGTMRRDVNGNPRARTFSERGPLSAVILQDHFHMWSGTAQINSISLTAQTANAFAAGSKFRVYKKL